MITNTTGIIILLFVAAAIAAIVIYRKYKTGGGSTRQPGTKLPDGIEFTGVTPKGVAIQAYAAIPQMHFDRLADIVDMGINNLLRATKATRPTWTQSLRHDEYVILFKKPDATNQDGSPAILVHGIQSAGTVVGVANDGFSPPMIVLPFQDEWNHMSYLMYSVWNEGEHYIEWTNDHTEFMQFAVAADIHPHRPMPEGLEIEMPPAAFGFKGVATRVQPKCGFKVSK